MSHACLVFLIVLRHSRCCKRMRNWLYLHIFFSRSYCE